MLNSNIVNGNTIFYLGAFFICVAVIILCIIVRLAFKIIENQRKIIDMLDELGEHTHSIDSRVFHIYDNVDIIQYDLQQRMKK